MLHFVGQPFLHIAARLVDVDQRGLQGGGHLRGGLPFQHRPLKGLPGLGEHLQSDPLHRQFQQLPLVGLLQLLHQVVAGLDRVESGCGRLTGQHVSAHAANRVEPGVLGEGLQPGAEAAGWVVLEGLHRPHQLQQHRLHHVAGIGRLQPPVPTPRQDPRPIPIDKLLPCLGVVRHPPQPRYQRGVGLIFQACGHDARLLAAGKGPLASPQETALGNHSASALAGQPRPLEDRRVHATGARAHHEFLSRKTQPTREPATPVVPSSPA